MAGAAQEQMLVPRFKNGRKTMVQYESVMPKGYHAGAMVGGGGRNSFLRSQIGREGGGTRGSEAARQSSTKLDMLILVCCS